MADDQGWGEMGYNGHPILKTPHLDAMAANGIRFDRFYAGAPVCSPTRAAVLTGRTNDRTGVLSHGYALRRQEHTLAKMLRDSGYVTGHFGKWHLNGYRGPGVPILDSDDHNPGEFGFDHWLSVTNFFDQDPMLSRRGKFEEFTGDSSEVVVDEALKFIRRQVRANQASFTVIWFGTPHSPFKALEADQADFKDLNSQSRHHYGELVALDRSIGSLRAGLKQLDADANTLVWYCSDNGGLPKIEPATTGELRGYKGDVFEGGLRVPAIIEWPAVITQPSITKYPASVVDIVPTLLEITGTAHSAPQRPADGISLLPLIRGEASRRDQPIGFRFGKATAWIDDEWKLVSQNFAAGKFQLYNLMKDPKETTDLSASQPEALARLQTSWRAWNVSVEASFDGADYDENSVDPNEPEPRFWKDAEEYRPYLDRFRQRWEYSELTKPNKR
ncbi:Arylsulfatase precursor [Rubripirellula tenax]|uniref:Arylsulfatase n=2 Tax=Rubripirellula tenax TaxID=2528015 RepID=A0A5C6FL15_9BACT|nr:Arylsulfatase precursor [Rubripirellula tenax]